MSPLIQREWLEEFRRLCVKYGETRALLSNEDDHDQRVSIHRECSDLWSQIMIQERTALGWGRYGPVEPR